MQLVNLTSDNVNTTDIDNFAVNSIIEAAAIIAAPGPRQIILDEYEKTLLLKFTIGGAVVGALIIGSIGAWLGGVPGAIIGGLIGACAGALCGFAMGLILVLK